MLHFDVRPVRPSEQQRLTTIAVIPARYQSTRLPGKPLLDLAGVPMIARVYDRVRETPGLDLVLVATDDDRVHQAMLRHGGASRMTSPDHRSGTDRLAEIAAALDCDLVVNVQGDEPLIDPRMIAEAVVPFAADPSLEMSTLCRRLDDEHDYRNEHLVKVVRDREGFALYFSRAPIPHHRTPVQWPTETAAAPAAFKHIGLYVYRRATLLRLASLAPTPLESAESLEQLRALEHGIRIKAVETRYDSIGVDTPDDLARVRALLAAAPAGAHDHA